MRICFLFCLILIQLLGIAQVPEAAKYPKDYFRSPVDIPLLLAGNFGELRSNHFHAGIDIKTQGAEGKRIYAVADGYISKIKIQERGYGKVIYVQHPNGYTSVYAHLRDFFLPIEKRVKTEQYQKQSYTIELFLLPHEFPVKKGDVIGFSGNSGGSVAPHLHFEVRETANDLPINPLFFGFKIADNVAPEAKALRIYPLDNLSTVNGLNQAQTFKAVKSGLKYTIIETPKVQGKIGFGLEAIDRLSGANNACGVYSYELSLGKNKIYDCKLDKVPSVDSKYINAHTDFEFRKKTGRWFTRGFMLPGNQLEIYGTYKEKGAVQFNTDSLYLLSYLMKDAYGNSSSMDFKIQSVSKPIIVPFKPNENVVKTFNYQEENTFQTDDFKIYFAPKILYQNIEFEYKVNPGINAYSSVHVVHNLLIPLHKEATISIKCLKEPLKPEKLVAVHPENSSKSYLTGTYINGWFNFNTRILGNFYLEEDVESPKVKGVNIFNGKNVSKQKSIVLEIGDDKAGIASYNAFINDQWVLMEYDYKKNTITHHFDGKFSAGVNQLKVLVKDNVGNETVFECSFIY